MGERLTVEPGEKPLEIEGDGGGNLLKVGLGKANITRLTSLSRIDRLRDGAFNASAPVVEGLEVGGGLALSSRLQGDKEGLGWEGQVAGTVFTVGAQGAKWTRPTDTLAELHGDDGTASESQVFRPRVADLTGRTGHLMRVPINLKVGNIEGLLVLSLPAHVGTQGRKEIHAVFGLAAS